MMRLKRLLLEEKLSPKVTDEVGRFAGG